MSQSQSIRGRSLALLACRTLFTLVLLAVVLPARAEQDLRQTQEQMAQLYEQKEDYDAALKVWRELLAGDPKNPRYLERVAKLAVDLNHPEVALPAARRLVGLDPANPQYRARLANVLVSTGRHAEALAQLRWMLVRRPNSVELHRELAHAYEAAKRFEDALRQYDWLVARFPRQLEYRFARADIHGELDHSGAQKKELKAILRAAPRSVRAHREMAAFLLDQEKFTKAERALKTLLEIAPNNRWARARLAGLSAMRSAARRRDIEAARLAERWADWQLDTQLRAEDF